MRGDVLKTCFHSMLLGTVCLIYLGIVACSPTARPDVQPQPQQGPEPLEVTETSAVLFRFIHPESKTVQTATRLADIPEAARGEVIVMSDTEPTPAGWEHVLDLREGLPGVTKPTQGYVLRPALTRAKAPQAARSSASTEVVMFSTRGCGFCRKAAAFFKANKVPFTEFDLERDRKAGATLEAMAKASKTPLSEVQGGVPVIFIDGKPHVGFDQPKIARLLGI